MSAAEIAFRIGRRIGKHWLAGSMFCLTERLLPLNRIARRDCLVAFHHPRPVADPHVLIVPTRPVASLTTNQLATDQMGDLIWKMVGLGREVTSQLAANEHWQMTINGGTRQDIGQLHAHLLHMNTSPPNGIPLTDPATEPGNWHQVYAELCDADFIEGSGFSLVIQWTAQSTAIAEVTKSRLT